MTILNERIKNYIRDIKPEEAQELVKLLPSELMSNELARRERVKSDQLSAINWIIKVNCKS